MLLHLSKFLIDKAAEWTTLATKAMFVPTSLSAISRMAGKPTREPSLRIHIGFTYHNAEFDRPGTIAKI